MKTKRIIVIDPSLGGRSPTQLYDMLCKSEEGLYDASGKPRVWIKCFAHVLETVRSHRDQCDAIKRFTAARLADPDTPDTILGYVIVDNGLGLEADHVEQMLQAHPAPVFRPGRLDKSVVQLALDAYAHFTKPVLHVDNQ